MFLPASSRSIPVLILQKPVHVRQPASFLFLKVQTYTGDKTHHLPTHCLPQKLPQKLSKPDWLRPRRRTRGSKSPPLPRSFPKPSAAVFSRAKMATPMHRLIARRQA